MNEPVLTIFTPAYNRAKTLIRTYESLRNQTCKDFIWLIVDDGSQDKTRELCEKWREEEKEFQIQYIYKENGGMHTAHNVAYRNITTELNTCIDSDDAMPKDAVEKILNKWEAVKDKGFAGIIALDADMSDGKVIGRGFPDGLYETTVSGYYATGGRGDKKLIYRTDIINKYPEYPVFEGEKYFSLSYKYRMIDQDYKMAVLNEIVCLVEYQADGSTNNMIHQYYRNPKGFAYWRKIRMQNPDSLGRKLIDCIHYVAESRIAGNRQYLKDSPSRILTFISIPAGIFLEKEILKRNRK